MMPIRGQSRGRARARNVNGLWIGSVYKDGKQARDENKIVALAKDFAPAFPFDCPIELGVRCMVRIPASKSKKWKQLALSGQILPQTKPDLSNVIKHIEDALTGLFWDDDKQIVSYLNGTGKVYAEHEGYEIEIIAHDGTTAELPSTTASREGESEGRRESERTH